MKMNYLLTASTVGLAAMMVGSPAFAQSTGSVDFEEETAIVVTGARVGDVGGVKIPDTPKAKQEIGEELIRRQRPGQTVNDIVNLVPGVSFQNNDPWGSGGGSFTIRGFNSDRISQTVDGIPLNDSGNYALYTNQQQDPETLSSINVNLGSTDVDSPTASAVGGTINIRTKEPEDEFKLTASIAAGDVFAEGKPDSRLYMRGFAMIDTGDLTGIGTKAFVAGSYTAYDNPFNNYGKVEKKQVNARIWQDIGSNGDFVAVAGHYNENRNNFFGSFTLPDFPTTREERFYDINYPCTIPAGQLGGPAAQGPDGVASDTETYSDSTGCGAEFDRRYNPSNTGNIRGASRFSLMDNLVLTVDPSYQWVKANGGGPEDLREGTITRGGVAYTGFIGGGYYFGRDLNGDGDLNDRVGGIDPSQTQTRRVGVIASLAYELAPEHRFRLAYTWDRARHRQTGETGFLQPNGEPYDVFPVNDPVLMANGEALNKRDRLSYAILHQVSGEYRGEFGNLTAILGLRAPFFTRELNQNCYTTTANASQAFIDCIGSQDPTAFEAANPYVVNPTTGVVTGYAPPQSRTYKYEDLLPNVGFTYDFGRTSVFASYTKGLSVPGTDPLYASLYFPADFENVRPAPETTDSFDLGLRYQSGRIQAQISGYYTMYDNRLATAFDPEQDAVIFRNLGRVDKFGIDGSVAWQPNENVLLYVFGSYNDSEIKNNLEGGTCSATGSPAAFCTPATAGQPYFIELAGKSESGSPRFMVGGRGQVSFGDFDFGAQVKHYGKRFVNDENRPIVTTANVQLFPAQVDSYTLVDLDIRYKIAESPTGGDVAIQLNVSNLFDELHVSGFSGSLDRTSSPFVQIGPPRAASISLMFGY